MSQILVTAQGPASDFLQMAVKSAAFAALGAACLCGVSGFSTPPALANLDARGGARVAWQGRARRAAAAAPLAMNAEHDILLRAAKGEATERSPVWLMRQAGRYMKEFRAYSNKYPFRQRSETPEIAIELSMQPFRAFGTDGVIMFSDILTPLPSMGIEFDVVKGSGPVIFDPIRSMDQVPLLPLTRLLSPRRRLRRMRQRAGVHGCLTGDAVLAPTLLMCTRGELRAFWTQQQVKKLRAIDDPDKSVPFLREIISSLRKETEGKSTLLGFIGSPFTLAAYAVEGKANKNCFNTKLMMYKDPAIMHAFLDHIAENIAAYAIHQIDCGAQVLQVFESWAHHLGPDDFDIFAKPYADKAIRLIKEKHPNTPIIYFANGNPKS